MGAHLRRSAGADDLATAVAAFGPRSMIQSDARMTSRLCSITSSEWPAASSLRNAAAAWRRPRSAAPSSARRTETACRDASCWRCTEPASARCPASFSRCASPPDSVGTGWPSFTYSSPTSASGASRAATSLRVGEEGERLSHRHVQHFGDARAPAVRALALDVQHLVAIAAAVAVRAAQIHVRQELHLDVLEAVAAAGRAATVAGVEAERAGGVLALLRRRLGGEQMRG